MHSSLEKLASVRTSMKERNIDAYIIPSSDPHLSEYIPDYWKIIPWLTGFTGSAATVIVTENFAGLWTDSRYSIQAQIQIAGSGFELMKPIGLHPSDFIEWLASAISEESNIAFDGRLFSITQFRKIVSSLEGKKVTYINDSDLISDLFVNRPAMPASRAWDHKTEYSGKGPVFEDCSGETTNGKNRTFIIIYLHLPRILCGY